MIWFYIYRFLIDVQWLAEKVYRFTEKGLVKLCGAHSKDLERVFLKRIRAGKK